MKKVLTTLNGNTVAMLKEGKIYIVERYFKKYRKQAIDFFECNYFVII